jgi:RNA polymerase sigma-70 factor (ECF subfamily)
MSRPHEGRACEPDHSRSASSSLLERARAHDASAWSQLEFVYGPIVLQWCRRARLQDDDAADVKQEVFRAVAGGIDEFRRNRPGDSFRGWLFGITRHKINDLFRRLAKTPAALGGSDIRNRLEQEPDPLTDDASSRSDAETGELLRRALELLRTGFAEPTWKAFWQIVVEDRSPAEVAAELNMNTGAVYTAKSRVLRRLREEFAGLEEFVVD